MGADAMVVKECNRANMERRVCSGRVNHQIFFRNIYGHLLMSGMGAGDLLMLEDMIRAYAERADMPTIILTSRRSLLERLADGQGKGGSDRLTVSSPARRNYHPMYGMSAQQVSRLIKIAGEEAGCGAVMDQVLLYASSVIHIVSASYPVSLPALSALLRHDDDTIAALAEEAGMSNIIKDNILGSHEAGIVLRRILEKMEEAFEDVALPENDTKYNLLSGSRQTSAVMAFYQTSGNQRLMNAYLKEELYAALKQAPRLRIVLDEVSFLGEEDELLVYLMQMKRQGKIELAAISENAKEMLPGIRFDFGNVCLFLHAAAGATEELSRELFGTYQYYYPACASGRPPSVFFTLERDVHWHAAAEERLKVRAEDLYCARRLFGAASDNLAIKTTSNSNVYLVPVRDFF